MQKKLKFELTTKGSGLRRTSQKDGFAKEVLYTKVENAEDIKKIQQLDGTWTERDINSGCGYIVREHLSEEDKLTGYVKIVKKSKASVHGLIKKTAEVRPDDWEYYKRRNMENEV